MKYNEPLDGDPDDPYVDANPATGLEGSQVPAAALEFPQREIVAVIVDRGITPSNGDPTQLLQAIRLIVGSGTAKGMVVGRYAYLSATQVQLLPVVESSVFVELDGLPVSDSAITFDITSDLQGGQSEGSSKFYYAYVSQSGGALVPHLSETPPVTSGGKVGYHPTNLTWRYVGSVYNDASSNFAPFTARQRGAAREYLWRTSSPNVALGNSLATYTLKTAQRAPANATGILAELHMVESGDKGQSFLGHSSLAGQSPTRNNAQVWTGTSTNFATVVRESTNSGWVDLDSSLQFVAGTAFSLSANELYERGYREG